MSLFSSLLLGPGPGSWVQGCLGDAEPSWQAWLRFSESLLLGLLLCGVGSLLGTPSPAVCLPALSVWFELGSGSSWGWGVRAVGVVPPCGPPPRSIPSRVPPARVPGVKTSPPTRMPAPLASGGRRGWGERVLGCGISGYLELFAISKIRKPEWHCTLPASDGCAYDT